MEKKYFLTLVDDYSRYTWSFLLPSKADVVVVIKEFLLMVQTVYSSMVKCLRTDNGCEFFNSQMNGLLKSFGTVHQSSCSYTPQQNGVAERKHRHILEVARAIRFQAGVPLKFWGYCVTTAVYIINRLPSAIIQDKSPFERLHRHSPSLAHMKVFGCLGYVTQVRKVDKFSPRAIPAAFLGYLVSKRAILCMIWSPKYF